jgi:hypothetical protein
VSDGATLNGSRSLTDRRRNNRVREQVLSAGEEAVSCAFPANDVGMSNGVKHPPNLDGDRVWPREENESRDNSESRASIFLLSSVGLHGGREGGITYSSE